MITQASKKRLLTGLIGSLFAAATASAAPVLWSSAVGGNNHSYEIILTQGITWDKAQADAIARGGYLATLTSAAENDFVFFSLVNDVTYWEIFPGNSFVGGPWIGGFQLDGSQEPAGGWTWVNDEGLFAYANWSPGEPNNNFVAENRLQFAGLGGKPDKVWNDAVYFASLKSYVVEYPELQVAVPEVSQFVPAFLGLAAVGAHWGMRRRRS